MKPVADLGFRSEEAKLRYESQGRATCQWKARSRRERGEGGDMPWFLLGKGRIVLSDWVDVKTTRLWRPDTCPLIFS